MLVIKNLKASINNREILKGLNLKINPGEVHAIMGQMELEKVLLQIYYQEKLVMKLLEI